MSVWKWINEFEEEAAESGDPDRQELCRLQDLASGDDVNLALEACEQGYRLARRLKHAWWEVFFLHWKLQHLIHHKEDLREVPHLAVQATLRATQPDCSACPQRICLHEDLISTYILRDPLGHRHQIEEALSYMEREISDDLECRYCLLGHRGSFALLQNQTAAAEESALKMLALLADLPIYQAAHYQMTAYARLCEVAYERRDWKAVAEYAREGEQLKSFAKRPLVVAEFLLWQAAAGRALGDGRRGPRLLARARKLAASTASTPQAYYSEALYAYHDLGGEHDLALAVREEELALLAGKGRLERECRCRLSICRLLGRLGRPVRGALREARAVVRQMLHPEALLAELDRIEGEAAGQ